MKRKAFTLTKYLSTALVSAALFFSASCPSSAKVSYLPEKCTGSKKVCDFWSSSDESKVGFWRYSGCYKSKVKVSIQEKKGSTWKPVKAASTTAKIIDETCDVMNPYSASLTVYEKTKGVKTYRLVMSEKGKRTYSNFKVKVSSYKFPSDINPSPSQTNAPIYSRDTYDYIRNMSEQLRLRPGAEEDVGCWIAGSMNPSIFSGIANDYKLGRISEALALSIAESRLNELAREPCFALR